MENSIVSEEKKKPVLDEHTLGKLLEAAYVLQEHNRELREIELGLDLKRDKIEAQDTPKSAPVAEPPKVTEPTASTQADYTFTLAQIVATQHQIQIRNLGLENSMSLVTERVIEITRAGGAGIGVLDGKKVRYRAVAGPLALKLGTEVPTEKALCLPCIRNAQVFRCADVNPEFLVDSEECRRRGIQSLIAVPIFHEGVATGGLELYYSTPHGFSEQDVHTCQLMAGLITEALAREEEHTWKQSLANERAVMLEAIEKLKPNLAALTDMPSRQEPSAKPVSSAIAATPVYSCQRCGNKLIAGEQFCGQCGLPRGADPSGPRKVAAAASVTEAPNTSNPADVPHLSVPIPDVSHSMASADSQESLADSLAEEMPELFAPYESKSTVSADPDAPYAEIVPAEVAHTEGTHARSLQASAEQVADLSSSLETSTEANQERPSEAVPLATVPAPADWSSAASARDFLEQLAETQQRSALARFWDARRGDIYLAVAVILVLCVIRWGIWSNHAVSATNSPNTPNATSAGHRKPAPIDPQANLSLFDRMLISFGLADAPEVPEDKGDPSIKVWIDLHTALYYCPGTDLYGKTPKGKYASQRDAQLDEYQPAYRKPCN